MSKGMKKVVLKEYISEKSIEFILKMYPRLNREKDIQKEIYKFLGYEDYNEARIIREELVKNRLIVYRHGEYPNTEYYSLEVKGVEYIKQENKDWIKNQI